MDGMLSSHDDELNKHSIKLEKAYLRVLEIHGDKYEHHILSRPLNYRNEKLTGIFSFNKKGNDE